MPRQPPLIDRFEAAYMPEPNSGCWIWVGAIINSKYPSHRRGKINTKDRLETAHRVSYKLFKGPIPTGLFVCHRCDTPLCVNPNHLWLGTHKDNMADKLAKGRTTKGRYIRQGISRPAACTAS